MFSLICIGDSIVYGRGESPSGGWVKRLKANFEDEKIHKGVYNLGIPGETTYSLRKRIKDEIKPRIWKRKSNDRYVLFIGVGGNDSRFVIKVGNYQTKLDKFKDNLNHIFKEVKFLVDEIVFVGLTPVDESKTQGIDGTIFYLNENIVLYNNEIKKIANDNGVKFVDLYDELMKQSYLKNLSEDGIHPNSKGYDIIYSVMEKYLLENKVLEN
jgi:lysophospholipase L1-like esterase